MKQYCNNILIYKTTSTKALTVLDNLPWGSLVEERGFWHHHDGWDWFQEGGLCALCAWESTH